MQPDQIQNAPSFTFSSLEELGTHLEEVLTSLSPPASKVFILADTLTRAHCLPVLLDACPGLDDALVLEMHAGESYKDIYTCAGLWREMSEAGADRHTLLINLGGGVVTDLGGFLAASFKRGIRFIHIPTSLLAMVDASLGGKTGVDLDGVKNVIGTFSFPLMTLICPAFLRTLDRRHLRSGFAEVIKHGLIADQGEWEEIRSRYPMLESWDAKGDAFRDRIIARSVAVKMLITEEDPLERGIRKVLNFGHTLGHAIESWSLAHDIPLMHGEAVAMGMVAEAWISVRALAFPVVDLEQLYDLINVLFPQKPPAPQAFSLITSYLSHDKKNVSGRYRFSLLKRVGEATYDVEIDQHEVLAALNWLYHVKQRGHFGMETDAHGG